MAEPAYDVIMLGGGLTGLTLAVALGDAGVRTALVEAADFAQLLAAPYDGRVMAVARASRTLLDSIGAFADMAAEAEPIRDIVVEEGGMPVRVEYESAALDGRPLGWIVETRVIRRALVRRLAALSAVDVFAPARARAIVREAGLVRVELEDGTRLEGALLAVGDGRMSKTRERLGIGVRVWDYSQTGIVCTLRHERPHHGLAIERFFPDGPFAVLPMRGNRSSIVWALEREQAEAVAALPEDEFLAEVADRFGDHLGAIALEGPRWCYPLVLVWAERYADHRLVLVGDTAHGIHPIAGQGWNLALRDVAALAEIVVEALTLGLDPGDEAVLARYEAWRRFDALALVVITDGINRLFANDLGPLKLARNAGLWAVQQLPPLKRFFMRHAMGLVGELPRLMRGERLRVGELTASA